MKRKLIRWIKNNQYLYACYRKLFNLLIRTLGLVMPVRKKIFFVSFNGTRFDDSPRVLYEKMMRSKDFCDYEYVWAFRNPEQYSIEKGRVVNFDSFRYYLEAVTSKIWVTNVAVERGLSFKKKETVYVNTWHGTPIKKLDKVQRAAAYKEIDIFCLQCDYAKEIFKSHFGLKEDALLMCDYPRNDTLLSYSEERINKIKEELHIPNEKKVILYMPTYRSYIKDEQNRLSMNMQLDLDLWRQKFGREYVLLLRLHYLVEIQNICENDGFIIPVMQYPVLNDLYAVSDLLISDYSSAYFDYCIMEKPMLCYAYDYDEYVARTGLTFSLEELPGEVCYDEDSLISTIENADFHQLKVESRRFKENYAPYAGGSAERVINAILEEL